MCILCTHIMCFVCWCHVQKCIIYAQIIYRLYSTGLDPALVGLSMAYAVDLTGLVQYTMRISAEVEDLVILM